MINSIQHFQQDGIKKIQKVFENYQNDFSKMAEMVYGITEEVTKLGCSMIAEEWESYDEILRSRKDLRRGWYIVCRDETMITTSLGDVTIAGHYSRTQKQAPAATFLTDSLKWSRIPECLRMRLPVCWKRQQTAPIEKAGPMQAFQEAL